MEQKVCNNYAKGNCTYGSRCKFLHPQGGGNLGGGGNSNFGGGNRGGNFGGGNQGGGGNNNFRQKGPPNRNGQFNQGKKNFRVEDKNICQSFIGGNCKFGDGCKNLHQFSTEWDIDGQIFTNIKEHVQAKHLEILDFYIIDADTSNNPMFGLLVLTEDVLFMAIIPDKGVTQIEAPKGMSAMLYEKDIGLLFVAYEKDGKGRLLVYKDKDGGGNFVKVAESGDLNKGKIMSIATIKLQNNVFLITGGMDGHIFLTGLGDNGFGQSIYGMTDEPVYCVATMGTFILAGTSKGKLELHTINTDKNQIEQIKKYDTHPDEKSICYKIVFADDCFYSITFNPENQQGQGRLSIFAAQNKFSHLISTDLRGQPISICYMPYGETIVIGYMDGTLEFRNQEGFIKKGDAKRNKSLIREIRRHENFFFCLGQYGDSSVWVVFNEEEAQKRKDQYIEQHKGSNFGGGGNNFGGGGNNNFGGGGNNFGGGGNNFGGGGMFN